MVKRRPTTRCTSDAFVELRGRHGTRKVGVTTNRELHIMFRIASLTSFVLASLLACACTQSSDEAADQGAGAATAGPTTGKTPPDAASSQEGAAVAPDIASIISSEGISLANLERFLGADRFVLVIHNPGAHLDFVEMRPLEADRDNLTKTHLRSLLEGPIRGEVVSQNVIVSKDCASETWVGDSQRPVDATKIYRTRVDSAAFDGVISQLAQGAATPSALLTERLESLEMKTEIAISVPGKPLVLYFGRVGEAWRLHGINITTPCDA